MASTQCSECDEEIEIAGRTRLGQKITCNHCGAQLEVVATEPLEVEIAQEDEEDLWEEELDDEELEAELDDELDELDDEESEELDDLDDLDDIDDDDFEDDLDDFEDDDFDEDDDDDRW